MGFPVKMAFKSLRRHILAYIPTIFLSAICVAVLFFLVSGLTSFLSANRRVLMNPSASDFTVIFQGIYEGANSSYSTLIDRRASAEDRPIPITEADMDYLQTSCGSLKVKYLESWSNYDMLENGKLDEWVVYYVSDDYYKEAGLEPCVILPSERLDIFKGYSESEWKRLNMFKLDLSADGDSFETFKGVSFPIVLSSKVDFSKFDLYDFYIPELYDSMTVSEYVSKNGVIAPVQAIFDCYIHYPYYFRLVAEKDIADVTTALKYLSATHWDDFAYALSPTSSQILDQIRDQRQAITALLPGTLLLLFVVAVSFFGIQIIQFERNKRNLAVAMTLGASYKQLLQEALIKGIFPPMLGGIIGCAASTVIMYRQNFRLMKILLYPSMFSVLLTLLVCLMFGIFATLPVLRKLKNLSPITVLKDTAV